jgi:hypothetical protein
VCDVCVCVFKMLCMQGEEAAECCRLLTYVILSAIEDAVKTSTSTTTTTTTTSALDAANQAGALRVRRVLGALPSTFQSPVVRALCAGCCDVCEQASVMALACSQQEERDEVSRHAVCACADCIPDQQGAQARRSRLALAC